MRWRRACNRRTVSAIAAIVAFAMFVAGCAKQTHGGSNHDSLVVAYQTEPASLNPLFLSGAVGFAISEFGYSYLTNYDSNGAIVPDVASAVPSVSNGGIARGGTEVTFRLRRGVVWADGVPLTSRDVTFTFGAIVNPANLVQSRYGYDRVASVGAPDPYTVVVHLPHPYSPIVAEFFGGDSNYPILPAHLLAKYPDLNHVAFNAAPVGSGPYRVTAWNRGDRLTFLANDRYFAGRPAIARVDLRFLHDSSTAVNQLLTGEADATFFADVSRIASLRTIPHHRIVVTPVPYFYALAFNLDRALTGDVALRRAFGLAIDRRTLVQKITHGLYDARTGMRGLFTWAYDARAGNVTFDPPAASALLDRAGWRRGDDGIRVKDGRRLSLQFAFYGGSEIEDEFVPAIVEEERSIGLEVSVKRYAREQFTALDGPLMQGRFDVALYSYQSDYDPDPSWLLSCAQRSPHGFNSAHYCNAAVERAMADGIASYDRSARSRAYALVQRQLLKDVPYDFLCQVSEIDVVPDWLRGFDRPLLSPFVSVARWH